MLKKTLLLFAAMAVIMCSIPTGAGAAQKPVAPAQVNLSPNIAQLVVREKANVTKVSAETGQIRLVVPATVNPDTFSVLLNGFDVANISFSPLMPENDDPASQRGALIAKIEAAQAEKSRLEGQKKSIEARIALWTTKPSEYSGPNQAVDLDKLDAGLDARLPDLYAALSGLPDKINAVAERISYYERDLAALGGKRQQLAEVIVAFSGNIPATVDVEYSYYAYGCGWQPVYGFAADPEKSSLDFRQQAYIWQNTGQDWNGARVVLSTKAPDFRLAPGNLYPWTLYREEEAKPNQAVKMQESMMMFDEEMAAPAPAMRSMAKAAEQPVSMQRSSHLEWALGPRVIPSGTPVTLTLQEDKWQAEFYYTLRPSLGTESFVTAKVKLPKAVELSNGRAVFTLDKRLCGTNNNFSANSNEFELYFGTDDRVTVETLDLLKQRGKEGFFTTTNTFNWEWQFTVKNRRDRTITIRLEDPMPQAADSSIKIKNDSSPKPEKEKMTYFWKADVKAGQDLVITHKVHASASGEQRLIPGR